MAFEKTEGYLTNLGGSPIRGLNIFEIDVDRNVSITQQPIEDGSQRQDSKVREPITVTLNCGCKSVNWDSVKGDLAALFKERTKKTCNVCTKAEFLKNMALVSFPYNVSPEHYDVLMFSLTLQEVIVVGQQSVNDFNSASSSENNSTTSTSATESSDYVPPSAVSALEQQMTQLKAQNQSLEKQLAEKNKAETGAVIQATEAAAQGGPSR